jgi:hypothetical protein
MGLWTFLSIGGFLLLWVVTGRSADIMTPEMLTLLGIQGTSGIAAVLIDAGKAKARSSGNFFRDILSDGESVSFHRFQMFAWSLVLAVIFVWSVFSMLSFPNFGTNLLLLSGLANGLYLGFKWPEAK